MQLPDPGVWSFRKRILVPIMLCSVIVLVFYQQWLKPVRQSIEAAINDHKAVSESLRVVQQLTIQLQQHAVSAKQKITRGQLSLQRLHHPAEQAVLLRQVLMTASKQRVLIDEVEWLDAKKGFHANGFSAMRFKVRAVGRFSNMLQWLYLLSVAPSLLQIEQLTLAPDKFHRLSLNVSMSAWYV